MSSEELKTALAIIQETIEVAQGLTEASRDLAELIKSTQLEKTRFVERQQLLDATGLTADNIKANMPFWKEGHHYINTSNKARPAYRYNVARIREWFETPAEKRNTVKR